MATSEEGSKELPKIANKLVVKKTAIYECSVMAACKSESNLPADEK